MITSENYKHVKYIVPAVTITNWSGFSNQPDGDGVEIVSDSASDVGKCTIFGTDKTTGAMCHETVTLTGTNAVSTTKTNWDDIVCIFLGNYDGDNITAAVGTITVREASGNQAITTLSAAAFHKGMFCLYVPGKNVIVSQASGKLYYHNTAIATATNGFYDAGTAAKDHYMGVDSYLYIISDDSGTSIQVRVMED